jgi:uncharacterized protein YceK
MNMKRKHILVGLFGLLMISPMGCATRQVRSAAVPVPTAVYPAIRTDCEMIGVCFDGGTMFHGGGPVGKTMGYTVVPLCWIVDIPLSVVTDTLCLPRDVWRINRQGENRTKVCTVPK